MKRTHTCGTCMHFRPGASSDMTEPAPIDSDDEMGVCEYREPRPEMRHLGPPALIGFQPAVHASRSCPEYMPRADYDGGDDDDGLPVPGNVRHLTAVSAKAA